MAQVNQAPLIGLTTYGSKETGRFYIPGLYVEAVCQAGGIPILLPPVLSPTEPSSRLEPLDGLVMIGGGDIEPSFYDGSPHPAIYGIDTQRDSFELALVPAALRRKLPLLGICRGLEIIVVAGGGKLLPHVPDAVGEQVIHRSPTPPPAQHLVTLLPSSRLAQIMGVTEVTVVSLHHQAAQSIPSEWRAVAWAEDGLIEAIEYEHHPFAIAVQWHPELSPSDPSHQRLFQAFIAAATSRALQCQPVKR